MDSKIISHITLKLEKKTEKHHYAYFLKGNKLLELTMGKNSFIKDKTCTTKHAEMDALEKLLKKKEKIERRKLDIVVIKINKNGDIGEAKPCLHCINILNNSKIKIKNVYYSSKINNSNFIIKEKFTKMIDNNINDKKILSKALRYKCGDRQYYE